MPADAREMTPELKAKILARSEYRKPLAELRADFARERLTLYLGAGVSRDSGLPNWNTLIATMYYGAVEKDWHPDWQAYPNYLYALGEWLLTKSGEPPEVIAGKIETYYGPNSDFGSRLLKALYWPWTQGGTPTPSKVRQGNRLLTEVANLCEATIGAQGVHAVVTTNYDSLLELSLKNRGGGAKRFVPVWEQKASLAKNKKGIFHVHGYLPPEGGGSSPQQIMLTEAQYHGAASDPYSWSNLTLIQCFSASTGLMIGMSMTDRNLRRLLHALHQTQLRERQYVILKKPEVPAFQPGEDDVIHERAQVYQDRFEGSGVKTGPKGRREIMSILEELILQEKSMAEKSLASMGVTPLWVESFDEVPVLVEAVRQA